MNWKIVLTGDKFDLENISKDLNEKHLSIVKENEQFILKSEEFRNDENLISSIFVVDTALDSYLRK